MPGRHSKAFRAVLAATLFGLVVMVALAAVLGVIAASDDEESPAKAGALVAEPTANDEPAQPDDLPPSGEPPPPATAEPEPPDHSAATEPKALRPGRLEPGRYAVERFDPDFSLALGTGWTTRGDDEEILSLAHGEGRDLTVVRAPSHVFIPGTLETHAAPADMLKWVRSHPCVQAATKPAPVSLAGNAGMQIEFEILSDPGCSGAYWEIDGGRVYRFAAGERDRLIALTVNAQGGVHDLLVNVSTVVPAEFDAFLRRATRVLRTIEFT